jgi:two-component system NarL family response regulator
MIRVLLVNEMLLMCNVITAALEDEPDIRVVGCATTVEDALQKAHQKDVDVLLVSTRLTNQGALTLTQAITEEMPTVSVLLLGLTERKERVLKYLEAGAAGYVKKNDSVDDLVEKIRAIQEERVHVSPVIAAALIERLSELAQMFAGLETSVVEEAGLTPREMDVLELLGQNRTNQEIADQLNIEVGTVKNHVHNILEKLDVSSRSDAAAYLAFFKSEADS